MVIVSSFTRHGGLVVNVSVSGSVGHRFKNQIPAAKICTNAMLGLCIISNMNQWHTWLVVQCLVHAAMSVTKLMIKSNNTSQFFVCVSFLLNTSQFFISILLNTSQFFISILLNTSHVGKINKHWVYTFIYERQFNLL